MIWVWVIIVTLVAVEAFLRTPFKRALTDLAVASKKSASVISSKSISDHWKEKVLPRYAAQIFKNSIYLFLCLLAIVIPVAIGHFASILFSENLLHAISTWQGVGLSVLVACIYVGVRNALQKKDKDGYSLPQKLLHYAVLSIPVVNEALFDLEVGRAGKEDPPVKADQHVFVSGLARAGTTVLMRSLYETDQFGSLTYADMPFVLAPSLWSRLRGQVQKGELHERAHGDGVMVDNESPEALDEVFWRAFARDDYVAVDCLKPHSISPELQSKFNDYVAAILRHTHKNRYLSKNNNNLLRIEGICEAFPNSLILVPFRSPVQHALSLLRQHRQFSERQTSDRFTRHYMGWLGHYEFGLDHRRMVFGSVPLQYQDPSELNYWLEIWLDAYLFVLDHAKANPEQIVPVGYELLCEETEIIWPRLCSRLNLENGLLPEFRVSASHSPDIVDGSLLEKAESLYQSLDQHCRTNFIVE